MEIGEAIAVLTPVGENPCPFCSSEADPAPVKKEMINDSSKLAENCGGMPHRTMRHPEADFTVFERYYVSDAISGICFNAHHIVPGNAAGGRCPQILEWMAGTTSIKKKFYDKPIQMKLKKVKASKRDAERAKLVVEKFPDQVVPATMFGDPAMSIIFSTVGGKSAIHRDKTVSENKVFGMIAYDVNDNANGAWLPSNNAVDGWTLMADDIAKDHRGRSLPFPAAYASNAMKVSKMQFHDAHEAYSAEVVDKLREIAQKLRDLAVACLEHDDPNGKKGAKFHAPERLTGALHKLASLIVRDKLNLRSCTGAPAPPWVTSDLAVFGEKHR